MQFLPSQRAGGAAPGVTAVERALDLLEALEFSERGLTLSDIARKLTIPKSSAHRLVRTLLNRWYLQRGLDAHHYILGVRVFDFADSAAAASQLRMVSFPYAQELAKNLNLTALLAVRRNFEAVIIAKVDSPWDNYPGAWVGHHLALHCTALGKALIAHLSDTELDQLFRHRSFATYTPSTLCSLEALKADLVQVRSKGFATNNEEYAIGGRSVGAPIFNHTGRTVASICVRGSTSRFPDSRIASYGNEVVRSAKEISRHLLEYTPLPHVSSQG